MINYPRSTPPASHISTDHKTIYHMFHLIYKYNKIRCHHHLTLECAGASLRCLCQHHERTTTIGTIPTTTTMEMIAMLPPPCPALGGSLLLVPDAPVPDALPLSTTWRSCWFFCPGIMPEVGLAGSTCTSTFSMAIPCGLEAVTFTM